MTMNGYYFNEQLNYIYRNTEDAPHSETTLHSHKLCEILLFESGDGELCLGQKKQMLFSGALVILPKDTMHFINILSGRPYRRHILHFEDVQGLFNKPVILDAHENSRIISVFSRMKDYNSLFDGKQKTAVFSALLTELVALISKTEAPQKENRGEFMTKATEYIENNINQLEDITMLCASLCCSRAQLYREFRKALGVSPMKYITDRRLEIAQNLLKLGDDATKVCFRCGFSDYSAFYRAYKAKYGYSPNKTKIY